MVVFDRWNTFSDIIEKEFDKKDIKLKDSADLCSEYFFDLNGERSDTQSIKHGFTGIVESDGQTYLCMPDYVCGCEFDKYQILSKIFNCAYNENIEFTSNVDENIDNICRIAYDTDVYTSVNYSEESIQNKILKISIEKIKDTLNSNINDEEKKKIELQLIARYNLRLRKQLMGKEIKIFQFPNWLFFERYVGSRIETYVHNKFHCLNYSYQFTLKFIDRMPDSSIMKIRPDFRLWKKIKKQNKTVFILDAKCKEFAREKYRLDLRQLCSYNMVFKNKYGILIYPLTKGKNEECTQFTYDAKVKCGTLFFNICKWEESLDLMFKKLGFKC